MIDSLREELNKITAFVFVRYTPPTACFDIIESLLSLSHFVPCLEI
jgi:hypothetical protein